MATPLNPVQIRNVGVFGVIREAEVDSSLIPEGAVVDSQNFSFDRKGAAAVRPGMTGLGSTVLNGYPIWGLHNAQNGSMFAAVSQSSSMQIQSYGGSSWASVSTGGTANVRMRFLEAGGRTILLNYGSTSNMYSSLRFLNTSGAWATTGNPINPQSVADPSLGMVQPQYGETYKSRIYLAGTNSSGSPVGLSRLYFSEVINSSGNFVWTPASNYVDINPNDGENISGLKRYSLELLVFKPNYIYRFKTAGVDPDPLIRVGTRSNESVVEGKRGIYFHHDSGFFRYSGGYPEEISRPISDITASIPFNQFDDIGGWRDSDHIYWALGNINVSEPTGTMTIKNCVARYTESSQIWALYSHAQHITQGATYTSASQQSTVVGTQYGSVATYNSGNTDMGEPVEYRLRTKWYEWEGIASRKILQEMTAICERAQNATIMYRVDEKLEWQTIGTLTKLVNFFDKLSVRFNRIQFQVVGISRGKPPVFRGLDIVKGQNEGLVYGGN